MKLPRSLKDTIAIDMDLMGEVFDNVRKKVREPDFWKRFSGLIQTGIMRDSDLWRGLQQSLGIEGDRTRFLAIDGTRARDRKANYYIFFAGAFGQSGWLECKNDSFRVKYESYHAGEEPCMVAFVPIPDLQIPDSPEDTLIIPAADMDAGEQIFGLDSSLMTLAELYLAIEVIEKDPSVKILLMDRRLASVQAHAAYRYFRDDDAESIRLLKTEAGASLVVEDLNIAKDAIYAFPVSQGATVVPPNTQHRKAEISEFGDNKRRWEKCKKAFKEICYTVFRKRDPRGIKTAETIGDVVVRRFLTPTDFKVLTTIALHYLIELAIERKIMVLGLIKGTGCRYFTRNMTQVLSYYADHNVVDIANVGIYTGLDKVANSIHWSDLLALRVISEEHLRRRVPWTTVPYDSVFETLALRDVLGDQKPAAIRMQFLSPPCVFLQSYAQFTEPSSYSYVWPVERIFLWNEPDVHPVRVEVEVANAEDKSMQLLVARNPSRYDTLVLSLLNKLISNRYPDGYGYPDPLYKADKIAVSYSLMAARVIRAFPTVMLSEGYKERRGRWYGA